MDIDAGIETAGGTQGTGATTRITTMIIKLEVEESSAGTAAAGLTRGADVTARAAVVRVRLGTDAGTTAAALTRGADVTARTAVVRVRLIVHTSTVATLRGLARAAEDVIGTLETRIGNRRGSLGTAFVAEPRLVGCGTDATSEAVLTPVRQGGLAEAYAEAIATPGSEVNWD